MVTKDKVIFPRYHQYDVVKKVIADVREKGPGTNYLIEHSAGSGKSNSIAWIAYRLASLHNDNNDSVFDSVIVVTKTVWFLIASFRTPLTALSMFPVSLNV